MRLTIVHMTIIGWRFGLDQRSCATSDLISTWMGGRLWTGKPSLYETSQLGQLSLSSLRG